MWLISLILLTSLTALANPAQTKRSLINMSGINQSSFFCQCIHNGGLFKQAQCGAPLSQKAEMATTMNLVPLNFIARDLKEYKEGHRTCSRGGKNFKGLECALIVNNTLKDLSEDKHNITLVEPSVKKILESKVLGVPRKINKLGLCPLTYDEDFMQLSSSNKGWLARVYLYLDNTYPEFNIKQRVNYPELEKDALIPPSNHECNLTEKINKIQTAQNMISKKKCEERNKK